MTQERERENLLADMIEMLNLKIYATPTGRICGQNSVAESLLSLIEQREQPFHALIAALEEYNRLLNDELSEVVGMAAIHGWKSHRYEIGVACREKISLAKMLIPSTPKTPNNND